MKKGESHDPELYQSQRKISIGDFVSTRMSKPDHFAEFDYPAKKVEKQAESNGGRSTKVSSMETDTHSASFYDNLRQQEFNKIFEKSKNLAKIYNGCCISEN